MSLRRPPALAAWLLDRLGYTRQNPALAGDLLEEFRSGRSRGWYWRQILIVIAKPASGRPGLKLLFFAGGVLTLYAWFLEPASDAVRMTLFLLGSTAVLAAGLMDSISKMRKARRQPYTTTDWLRGKRRPGIQRSGPLQRWLQIAALAGWIAAFEIPKTRHLAHTFVLLVYYLLIGSELFRQPERRNDAPLDPLK